MSKFKTVQLENMQFEHGLVYENYGEANQRMIGPTRGGCTFEATQTIRDIEFDGKKGKSKGMQVIDAIDCKLTFGELSIAIEDLQMAMPYLEKTGTDPDFKLECTSASLGLIKNEAYAKNITMFGKLANGKYKKISIMNAMNEAPFSLAAVPNGEGIVNMEVYGHWETDDSASITQLFIIEDVATITNV